MGRYKELFKKRLDSIYEDLEILNAFNKADCTDNGLTGTQKKDVEVLLLRMMNDLDEICSIYWEREDSWE